MPDSRWGVTSPLGFSRLERPAGTACTPISMPSTPTEVVARVVLLLDRLEIKYLIGGSLASAAYGTARTTADADFVVDLTGESSDSLATGLEGDFYMSRDAMREAIQDKRSFNAIHLDSLFKIDFFVLGTDAFDREEFRRRVPREWSVPPGRVVFKTPEDTVLRKLQWFRSGGETSEQQWKDILGVLAVSGPHLDRDYMEHWSAHLQVGDLLAKATREAQTP
jgi:hypothetical protein